MGHVLDQLFNKDVVHIRCKSGHLDSHKLCSLFVWCNTRPIWALDQAQKPKAHTKKKKREWNEEDSHWESSSTQVTGGEVGSEGDSTSPPPYKNPLSFPLRLATTSIGFPLLFFSKFFVEAADVIIVFFSNTRRRLQRSRR